MERYVNLNSREITCGAFMLSRVQIFMTPWTVVHQVSLYMEFSRQVENFQASGKFPGVEWVAFSYSR